MLTDSTFVPLPFCNYTLDQRNLLLREGFLFTSNGSAFPLQRFNIEIGGRDYPICPLEWQTKISQGFLRYYTDKSRGYHKLFDLNQEEENARLVLPSSESLLGLITNFFISLFVTDSPRDY
jgi:hypothetical protein